MEKNNFLNIETKRAEILNIFSALFCQPEEEFIKNSKVYDTLKSSFEIINPDCVSDVQKMQDSLTQYSTQDLLIEYARLFIGPFKIEVPPYSSLYFSERILMSNVTLWVLEYYKSAGLDFDKNVKDLPDHIAVETEFLYYLLFNEINELNAGNMENMRKFHELQSYFIKKHYSIWVPLFCKKTEENSKNTFYKTLATCFGKYVRTWVIPEMTED